MLLRQMYKQLTKLDENLVWSTNVSTKDLDKSFYSSIMLDIWKAWSRFNFHTPTSVNQIKAQCLWYNSFIKDKKLLYLDSWHNQGLNYLAQLFDVNNKFLTCQEPQR